MWPHWGDGGWLGMSLAMLLWLVAAVVVVWLILRALTALDRRGRPGGEAGAPRETPEETLRRRLAAGEIQPEEYQRLRDLLRGG